MHKGKNAKPVPNYVIRGPRECKSIIVPSHDLKFRVLFISKEKRSLKGKKVLRYISLGERKELHKRPTCKVRPKWYCLGDQLPPDNIWFKAFNDRFFSPINKSQFYTSDRIYAIYLKRKKDSMKLAACLNSTISVLFVELYGRVNLGEGALDNMTYEAAAMLSIVPSKIRSNVARRFENLFTRTIEPIFKEIGAKEPCDVSLEKVKPDRRELDKMIMGDILGLTEEEQLEVYRAVIDLVKSRIDKAKSVKKKKLTDGVDLEGMSNDIIEDIEDIEGVR